MTYKIFWTKWLDSYIWDMVRKEKARLWLRAFIFPIIRLHNRFLAYDKTVQFELKITPQVCVLRWALNQKFDNILKRILIVDNANNELDYAFLSSENKPLFLPDFLNDNDYEFEVQVPYTLLSKEKGIKSLLNLYKLPSKRYVITYF
jgi:hypothetical protein